MPLSVARFMLMAALGADIGMHQALGKNHYVGSQAWRSLMTVA